MNVLFVCTGNTCRSPMAAEIFRKIVKERNLKNIEISSAGVAANNSSPASKNAVEVCKKINVDLSQHVSKSIFDVNLTSVDKFIVMTPSHRSALLKLSVPVDKIYILGNGVLDPFGGSVEVYEQCRDQIETALNKMLEELNFREGMKKLGLRNRKNA